MNLSTIVPEVVKRLFNAVADGKPDSLFTRDASGAPCLRFDRIVIRKYRVEYWYDGRLVSYNTMDHVPDFNRGDELILAGVSGTQRLEIES